MSGIDVKVTETDRGVTERADARVESLGPYQSLLLLAVPICLVEPMKLAGRSGNRRRKESFHERLL